MKKLMPLAASIVLILVAGMFASAGTMAWFTDAEQIGTNTFEAAYLDLELGPSSLPFTVGNIVPGDSGSDKKTLTNIGTIAGDLDVSITNLVQYENTLTEPELNPGYGTADYEAGPNAGELKFFLLIAVFIDVDQDGTFNTGDYQLAYNGQKAVYPGFWGGVFHYSSVDSMLPGWDDVMTMTAGSSVDLVIMWQFPTGNTPNYSSNIAMTDSLSFDIDVSLEQVGAP